MTNLTRSALLAAATAIAFALSMASARAEDEEQKIEADALPAAVRKTAESTVEGGKIVGAEVETEDGQKVYSVEVKAADGTDSELEISAEGKLLEEEKRGDDSDDEDEADEKPVAMEDLPAAVREAIKKELPDTATSVTVTKETEDGGEVYEAECVVGSVSISMEFGPNGQWLEKERPAPVSGLPAEVAKAVEKKHPGATIGEAEEVMVRFYELEITMNGKTHEVKVSPSGKISGDDEEDEDDND